MKYENKTTQQDKKDRIIRIEMTAENWEENKLLAKGMGIEIDEPSYIECTIDLKKRRNKFMNNELAEWIVKAIETIKSGIADKLEKDDAKVYRVPSPNGKAIIRIDVKE